MWCTLPLVVVTGLDRLAADDADAVAQVRGRKVGLLAHAASFDSRFRPAFQVLTAAGADVRAIFGPEHGFSGAAQDMIGVRDRVCEGELPIYSLYGDSYDDLTPKRQWLGGLDAIVVDLQDVGSRYYTYVWTAALMLKAAAARGVETIVLDRPNPLGGQRLEGAPQRSGYRSFVGLYDVPVRHGLTIGEVLELVRGVEGIDRAALRVIPMNGWTRTMSWAEMGLPWFMPSPNMPSLDTAMVYPGGCLLEGTLLSEGRGTTRPFELWGAPGLDVRPLLALELPGAVLRRLAYTPTFHKHAGEVCDGVQVHVTDHALFEPYAAYLQLIAQAVSQRPPEARWRTKAYEFVTDRPAIDLLTGGPEYREIVDRGESLDAYLGEQRRAATAFDEQRQGVLLY